MLHLDEKGGMLVTSRLVSGGIFGFVYSKCRRLPPQQI